MGDPLDLYEAEPEEATPLRPFVHVEHGPTAGGAFARHAAKAALPTAGGVAAFPAGMATGAAVGVPLDPFTFGGASAVLGVGGGLGASFFGGAAVEKAQDWLIPDRVKRWLGWDAETAAADEAVHPLASFAGSLAPQVAFMRPSTSLALKARAGAAAVGGGVEAGSEYADTGTIDPWRVGMQAGAASLLDTNTRLGDYAMAPAHALAANVATRIRMGAGATEEAQAARATIDEGSGAAEPEASAPTAATAFMAKVPLDQRTPDEAAALHVIDHDARVADLSPYRPGAAGDAEHGQRLAAASAALLTDRPVPDFDHGRAPLDRDSVIRFVINDLEGGAKVVHYSDADGGTTKYGIAAKHNPGVDVANLSEGQAAAIARDKYWFAGLDAADPRVAAIAFDAGYISGPEFGKQLLREAQGDPAHAIEIYRAHLDEIADREPAKAKYREGWQHRIDKLERRIGEAGPDVRPEVAELHATVPPEIDALTELQAMASGDEPSAPPEPGAAGRAPEGRSGAPIEEKAIDVLPADQVPPAVAQAPAGGDPEILALLPKLRSLVADRGQSLQLPRLAKALGVDEPTANRVLGLAASGKDSGLAIGASGTIRRVSEPRNPDLLAFLAKKGGIRNDEGHDLLNMKIKRMSAGGRVITRKGMSLDAAREAAAEAGYFHNMAPDAAVSNTTVDDFLQLLETASHRPLHRLEDLSEVADKAEAARRGDQDEQLAAALTGQLHERGIEFDEHGFERATAYVHRGYEIDEAIERVIDDDFAEALDDARREADDRDYEADLLPDQDYTWDPRDGGDGDGGQQAQSGDAGQVQAGDRQSQGERGLEDPEGDAARAGGRDLERLAAFDDPAGAGVKTISDSIEHDLRAALDVGAAEDPAIAARGAERAKLKAAAPLRNQAEQDGTMGLGLFDAADQPTFRLEEGGGDKTLGDALDDADAESAAAAALRACLPPKGAA